MQIRAASSKLRNDTRSNHQRKHQTRNSGFSAKINNLSARHAVEQAPVPGNSNDRNMMDRGLWITWYNLPEDGRTDYLAWLHEIYIPATLARSGVLWAAHYASVPKGSVRFRSSGQRPETSDPAVARGDRYILLFGARDALVFGNPTPSAVHAALPAGSKKLLAMRQQERTNIMTEVARVEGPAALDYKEGAELAPWIQFGSFQCAAEGEEDALAYYAQWRMPAMTKMPGCVRTRTLASVAGWAKHAILYEFVSLEARNHFETTHEDGDENREWTDRVFSNFTRAPGSSNVASRLWPPFAA